MAIDCTLISDLHGFFPSDLPGGDLLIVAGDLTGRDTFTEHGDFKLWLYSQDYKKKIVIAGNHDNHFVGLPADKYIFSSYNSDTKEQKTYAEYLCDSGTEFEGLKIWGTPWTKTFERMNPHCKAFTCETEEELEEKWAKIPIDIDILITHSPPYKVLDQVYGDSKINKGSTSLGYALNRIQPKLLVFGHIHESGGKTIKIPMNSKDELICVNCSHVNERYQPVNKPVRVIL